MNAHISQLIDVKNWIGEKPNTSDTVYAIERLEYYTQQLFKYAIFKVGDRVEIKKDMNITQETHPGWYSYRHLLGVGCVGEVCEVDHCYDVFIYDVVMFELGKGKTGTFRIKEEFLKTEGLDGEKNDN